MALGPRASWFSTEVEAEEMGDTEVAQENRPLGRRSRRNWRLAMRNSLLTSLSSFSLSCPIYPTCAGWFVLMASMVLITVLSCSNILYFLQNKSQIPQHLTKCLAHSRHLVFVDWQSGIKGPPGSGCSPDSQTSLLLSPYTYAASVLARVNFPPWPILILLFMLPSVPLLQPIKILAILQGLAWMPLPPRSFPWTLNYKRLYGPLNPHSTFSCKERLSFPSFFSCFVLVFGAFTLLWGGTPPFIGCYHS